MTTWIVLSVLVGAATPSAKEPSEGTNLALGKFARFEPAPNYQEYDEDALARQLCDGVYNGVGGVTRGRSAGQSWTA